MNITISTRAKSLTSLDNNRHPSIENEETQPSQQQKPISKPSAHHQKQTSHSSSQLTKWLLSKCFNKSNSIVEEQPNTACPHLNDAKTIHSLSSRRVKQDMVSTQQKSKINLLSSKCRSMPRSKEVKIKLETGREGRKNSKILEMKTCIVKQCHAEATKTILSISTNNSHHASIERLDTKINSTLANIDSFAFSSNHTANRIESFIQSSLKSNVAKQQCHTSKSIINTQSSIPDEVLSRHLSKKELQSLNKYQDCIYSPIFTINKDKQKVSTPTNAKKAAVIQTISASPSSDSEQSFVLSRGIEQVFNISAAQSRMNSQNCEESEESMFIIYEKIDEALEYE